MCARIILHNYNDLTRKRDNLLAEKEKFYTKYKTREDHVIWDIVTRLDFPVWDRIDKELFNVNELIERWERGYRKGKPP